MEIASLKTQKRNTPESRIKKDSPPRGPQKQKASEHLRLETFFSLGGSGETRTRDQRIKSPLL